MPNWSPRRAADFAHALAARLPTGAVWPRDPNSTLMRECAWLGELVASWAQRVARFLLIEAFPPSSDLMLPDWERVLGLPEPCLPVTGLTITERQQQVREKLARRPGRADRLYFLELAARLGYHEFGPGPSQLPFQLPGQVAHLKQLTITEYVPAQCGMTQCGAQVKREGSLVIQGAGCGTPAIRYLWTVTVPGPRLTWFAAGAGGGRTGQDPHLRIRRADDLECLLNKLKPAHTRLVFNYTGI